jgi:hypothetical protein
MRGEDGDDVGVGLIRLRRERRRNGAVLRDRNLTRQKDEPRAGRNFDGMGVAVKRPGDGGRVVEGKGHASAPIDSAQRQRMNPLS